MKSEIEIQLRYSDTDQMGVIHHSRYFQFFELGRLDFLNKFGLNYYRIEKQGLLMPIRDVGCTYLKSIKANESICVETQIKSYTKYQILFEHVIKNHLDEIKCKGHTKIVLVEQENFQLIRMDKAIPSLYKQLEALNIK